MAFRDTLKSAAYTYGLALEPKQLEQFTRYYELLIAWNAKMNLTAITDEEGVAVKHMVDSLTAYTPALFSGGTRVIDVGTGAGFPGIPLKIFAPHIELTLLDSLKKRIGFLETVVSELALSGVTCVHARAEDAARDKKYREQYDVACARAVARLAVLSEYTMPFVKCGGVFLAMKGRSFAEEAEEAKKAIKVMGGLETNVREVKLPGLDDVRAVIEVRKTMPTPNVYPRKAGTPLKKPIV